MRVGRSLLAAIAVMLATPAAAEDRIDYAQPLEALLGDIAMLGVDPPSAPPQPIEGALLVENSAIADHQTLALSFFCREEIINPADALVREIFGAVASPPETPSVPAAVVSLTAMSSSVRCFLDGDLDSICIAKATIRGRARGSGESEEAAQPIWAEIERTFNSDSACARRVRGVAYVTREAVVALAHRARNAIASTAAAGE
ncbi:MAG: hypothetical protein ABR601_05075 [Parasphingopyxis sp.]|nr:hypothetical protein [Sphingomonadales bacterium]